MKNQETMIEGRINYLKSQDRKIEHSVSKAHNFATKKKVTQKTRVLHELLMKRNYEQKLKDQDMQVQHVTELRNSEK